jgi:hypothetical protein
MIIYVLNRTDNFIGKGKKKKRQAEVALLPKHPSIKTYRDYGGKAPGVIEPGLDKVKNNFNYTGRCI